MNEALPHVNGSTLQIVDANGTNTKIADCRASQWFYL
jgi:hypothetical protein